MQKKDQQTILASLMTIITLGQLNLRKLKTNTKTCYKKLYKNLAKSSRNFQSLPFMILLQKKLKRNQERRNKRVITLTCWKNYSNRLNNKSMLDIKTIKISQERKLILMIRRLKIGGVGTSEPWVLMQSVNNLRLIF